MAVSPCPIAPRTNLADFGRWGIRGIGCDHECDRNLVANRVGRTHHRRLQKPGMRGEDGLDLDCGDVLAGHLQHVTASTIEVEATIGSDARPVAGQEPAIPEARRCGVGIVEVATEQGDAAIAADYQLTDLTGSGHGALACLDLDLTASCDVAHRVGAGLGGFVGEDGRDRLGHPVELPRPTTEPLRQRLELVCGNVLGEPAVAQRRAFDGGAAGQDHAEWRGEQAGAGRTVPRDLVEESACREPRHQRHRCTCPDGGGERVVLGVGVEERQDDDVAVVVAEIGGCSHGPAGKCVVGLADLDSLGSTGGATREHDRGAVGQIRCRPVGELDLGEGHEVDVGLVDLDDLQVGGCRCAVDLGAFAGAETDDRPGARDVVGQLGRLAQRIARHDPGTQPVRGQPYGDERGAVRQRQMYRRTFTHTATHQEAGDTGDLVVEVGVGPLRHVAVGPLEDQKATGRVLRRRMGPQVGEGRRVLPAAHGYSGAP